MISKEFVYTQGQPFSEETRHIEITPQQKAFGLATNRIYERRFKRSTPWMVKDGRILYFGPVQVKPDQDPLIIQTEKDIKNYGIITVDRITGDELAKEHISKDLAAVLRIFKRVEDNLPDFSKVSSSEFRSLKGVHRSYLQWGHEEAEHSNAVGFILTATGHNTQEELDEDYYKTQGQEWLPPFDSGIKILIFAMFQELNTGWDYYSTADRLEEQGAIQSAKVARAIGADEYFHGAGFRDYVHAYAEIYPEETEEAALEVAWNFRMPSLHLMRHRLRDTVRVMKTIGYNQEAVESLLRRGLASLKFVDPERAEEVVKGYWAAETARLEKIMKIPTRMVAL
jgi:hypothetical protein